MGAHKVFLVHGMGEHGDDWAKPYIEQLEKLWATYPSLVADYPLGGFEFVGLRYDDIFDLERTKLGTHNAEVIEALDGYGGLTAEFLTKLTSKLTGNAFVATHVMDVVNFYGDARVKEAVSTALVNQINQHFDAAKARSFSVVAHSLGTAVIQQALQAWINHQAGKPQPVTMEIRALMQISNVSKLLEIGGSWDVYESAVRPADDSKSGVCRKYLNVRNYLDPIWWPKAFEPLDQWRAGMSTKKRYEVCEFSHIQSENPHSMGDYLAHPAVHIPLFRALTGPLAIDSKTYDDRVREHTKELKERLKRLAMNYTNLPKGGGFKEFIEAMGKLDFYSAKG